MTHFLGFCLSPTSLITAAVASALLAYKCRRFVGSSHLGPFSLSQQDATPSGEVLYDKWHRSKPCQTPTPGIKGSHRDESLAKGLHFLATIWTTSRNVFLTFTVQSGSLDTKGLNITKVATPSVTFVVSRLLGPGFPQPFWIQYRPVSLSEGR